MSKNKKILLLLIGILILIYMAITIIPNIFSEKKYSNTAFIGDYTKIYIKNKGIEVRNDNVEIATQRVKVLFKNKLIDGIITSEKTDFDQIDYHYIAYNNEGVYLSPNSALLAFTTDLSIKIKEKTSYNSKNIEEVYDLFQDNKNIDLDNIELDYLNISSFDLTNDGKEESVYSVGLINRNENDSSYYSYVFMKTEDKNILIDKEESKYDGVSNIKLSLYNLIDFNNDGNYEFVVKKSMSEYGPDYYELYNFDGTKFTKIGGE